jgi:hypothetical protein
MLPLLRLLQVSSPPPPPPPSPSSFKVYANGLSRFRILTSELINLFGHLVGLLWMGDQPDARPVPTQDNTTQKKRGYISMPRAGFEPAIPMFERPKTVLALDRAAITSSFLRPNYEASHAMSIFLLREVSFMSQYSSVRGPEAGHNPVLPNLYLLTIHDLLISFRAI